MMEFSIAIGVIHIGISLFRYLRRNYPAFGWLIFLAGGYLYFPTVLKSTTLLHFLFGIPKEICADWGLQGIFIGVGLAMGLAIYQRKLAGLGEIANLVSIFGDVLSYLRIYALSLAGAIMAQTFNAIGEGIGLLLGVLAIIVGHSVNLVLSIQGGVIHGLRLNFLEWYHYCFEGGGRFFRPLKEWKQSQGDD
jgi:V/A-type H+-transporting ATPase subunit I